MNSGKRGRSFGILVGTLLAALALSGCGDDDGYVAASSETMAEIRGEIAEYRDLASMTGEQPRRNRMLEAAEATFVALATPSSPPVDNERSAYENSLWTLGRVAFSARLEECVYESLSQFIDRVAEENWRAEAMLTVLNAPLERALGFAGAHAIFYDAYVDAADDAAGKLRVWDRSHDLTSLSAKLVSCAA